MRVLAQRVTSASVAVAGEVVGEIAQGFLLLIGVTHTDSEDDARFLASKIANLRVFEDDAGQMNRSALDLHTAKPGSAGMLVVSQFTLYADARKGRRPSFVNASPPPHAAPLVDTFAAALAGLGLPVERGVFGAEMAVSLINDGPVTLWLDTAELRG